MITRETPDDEKAFIYFFKLLKDEDSNEVVN